MNRQMRLLPSLAIAVAVAAALLVGATGCRSEEQQACQARCEETGAGLGLCFQICDCDCAESEQLFGLSRVACERIQQESGRGVGG